MIASAPENRALTVAVCKRLGIWPLDRTHRTVGQCACPSCFGDSPTGMREPETTVDPAELAHLRAKRRRAAFFWEEDAAA